MDTKPNILQRINAVMKAVDYIQKEKKAGMRYSIVSHDAVTAKVRPLMVEHGIVYYPSELRCKQVGNRTQASMSVRFVNIDDPADFISVETAGYGIDDQDKGPGKAISYAVKYALLKAFGLESGDDPDLEQDVTHKPAAAPTAAKPPLAYDRNPIVKEAFTELMNGIRQCANIGTMEDLKLYWTANAKKVAAMPADWKQELEDMKEEAKAQLELRAA